jgi:hypothetical protein
MTMPEKDRNVVFDHNITQTRVLDGHTRTAPMSQLRSWGLFLTDRPCRLDPQLTGASQVMERLAPNTGVPLDAYPVSRIVNKPSVDGQELIRPIE